MKIFRRAGLFCAANDVLYLFHVKPPQSGFTPRKSIALKSRSFSEHAKMLLRYAGAIGRAVKGYNLRVEKGESVENSSKTSAFSREIDPDSCFFGDLSHFLASRTDARVMQPWRERRKCEGSGDRSYSDRFKPAVC